MLYGHLLPRSERLYWVRSILWRLEERNSSRWRWKPSVTLATHSHITCLGAWKKKDGEYQKAPGKEKNLSEGRRWSGWRAIGWDEKVKGSSIYVWWNREGLSLQLSFGFFGRNLEEKQLQQQQQGGDDFGCSGWSPKVVDRSPFWLSFTVLSPADEPVAVCVAVVVVHRVSVSHSQGSLEHAGRPRSWSLEQGGEFLDAAFMAPTDV